MLKLQSTSERGQTLVFVALLLIVLLIFVGFAVDGGMTFLGRRRMQNAADAGSLAGTRVLAEAICGNEAECGGEVDDACIARVVNRYAESNGVKDTNGAPGDEINDNVVAEYVKFEGSNITFFSPPVLVGDGEIPRGAVGVAMITGFEELTRFLSLANIDKTGATAYAQAVTGPPLTGGGLRPFGVPLQLMQTLDPGDSFTVVFKHNGGTIQWIAQHGQEVEAQHRGWMNFAYAWNPGEDPDFPRAIDDGIGASDLKAWMENGWNGTLYGGDFVHAKPGTDSSAVCAAPENELFYVPIYDAIPDCETQIYNPKPDCPTQGGGYCYHIVGFAGLKITDCNQGQGKITAELVETIIGEGVPSPSGGYGSDACVTRTMVVTLIE